MQKVLRRTALAKRQAARRVAKGAGKNRSDDRKIRVQEQSQINTEFRTRIIAARTSRREDWLLGPLAPKRDVGDAKDTYGTIGTRGLRGVEKAEGEWKDWCIEEGDRVVVVENGHRDRGKIGKVREVRARAEACTVEGLNLVSYLSLIKLLNVPKERELFTKSLLIGRCSRTRLHVAKGDRQTPFPSLRMPLSTSLCPPCISVTTPGDRGIAGCCHQRASEKQKPSEEKH